MICITYFTMNIVINVIQFSDFISIFIETKYSQITEEHIFQNCKRFTKYVRKFFEGPSQRYKYKILIFTTIKSFFDVDDSQVCAPTLRLHQDLWRSNMNISVPLYLSYDYVKFHPNLSSLLDTVQYLFNYIFNMNIIRLIIITL